MARAMSGKLEFLARSALRWPMSTRHRCLNCGGRGPVVARKYLVAALRRCDTCRLLYRTPTDPPEASERFYQSDYAEGATTDCPDPALLPAMQADGFSGQQNDYRRFAEWLASLGVPAGGRVLDFGSSWGYGSWILRAAGFAVASYELSRPRAQYGRRHLAIDSIDDFEAFLDSEEASFDAFFSSHVLEHVPAPGAVVAQAMRLLKPGGLFLAVMPNGSDRYRRADPVAWARLWGKVHPNFLDEVYCSAAFAPRPLLVGSPPFAFGEEDREHLRSGTGMRRCGNAAATGELMVAVRKG